jgi:hypothetical protein
LVVADGESENFETYKSLKLRFGSIPLSRNRMTDDRWDQMVRCSCLSPSSSPRPSHPALHIPCFHCLLSSRHLVQDIGPSSNLIPCCIPHFPHKTRRLARAPPLNACSLLKCSRSPQSCGYPLILSKPKMQAIVEPSPGQVPIIKPIKLPSPELSARCRSTYYIASGIKSTGQWLRGTIQKLAVLWCVNYTFTIYRTDSGHCRAFFFFVGGARVP